MNGEQLRNEIIDEMIKIIRNEFPDPNPLGSIFAPYVGDAIIRRFQEMRDE